MEKLNFFTADRPKILALDLDGTALHYDGNYKGKNEFGAPLQGMIEELIELRNEGVKIVVWTCREDSLELRNHLTENGVPFDYVNDHPWNGFHNSPKIQADWYLDDKNVEFNGVTAGLAKRILAHKPWWKDVDWA